MLLKVESGNEVNDEEKKLISELVTETRRGILNGVDEAPYYDWDPQAWAKLRENLAAALEAEQNAGLFSATTVSEEDEPTEAVPAVEDDSASGDAAADRVAAVLDDLESIDDLVDDETESLEIELVADADDDLLDIEQSLEEIQLEQPEESAQEPEAVIEPEPEVEPEPVVEPEAE